MLETANNVRGLSRLFRVYLMPAAVFQSVIVGGGYGTGREVVEYVTRFGPLGGLASIGVIFIIWAIVIALSFELARMWSAYDYRRFLKRLIGPLWIVFEIMMIVLLAIVLAVVLAAASDLIEDLLGIPKIVSVVSIIALVAWTIRYGSQLVENLLSIWAVIVSLFLASVMFLAFVLAGETIIAVFSTGGVEPGWAFGGATFAVYTISLVPVLLYTATAIRTRTEAIFSGVIAAAAGVAPAFFMHFALLSVYPAALDQSLPIYFLLTNLAAPGFVAMYFVVLLGTILQTAIGVLEGAAERIDGWLADQGKERITPRDRSLVGGGMLTASALLSSFGIIDLIARGYGTLAWGFLFVFVVPLLTIGFWRVISARGI